MCTQNGQDFQKLCGGGGKEENIDTGIHSPLPKCIKYLTTCGATISSDYRGACDYSNCTVLSTYKLLICRFSDKLCICIFSDKPKICEFSDKPIICKLSDKPCLCKFSDKPCTVNVNSQTNRLSVNFHTNLHL